MSYDPDGDEITTWLWDFGDGNSYGPSQALRDWGHRYASPGQYVVTLTVKDKFGATSSSTSRTINITAKRCKALIPRCMGKGFKK
ncbi:MAG: PKD domain-containing protein [Ectothiorhodospiraceae bacterium]|nr:PKD domain-containing protein [Ectothiorhodospiraceae bacterium]